MTDNNTKFPIEAMNKFIDVQAKELTIREKELEHSIKFRKYDHEYALKALDAQVKDREGIRQAYYSSNKFRYGFATIAIIGLFVLFCVAILYDKDQIVMEIIKAIIYVGVGALGGYSWGSRGKKATNSDSD